MFISIYILYTDAYKRECVRLTQFNANTLDFNNLCYNGKIRLLLRYIIFNI